MVEPGAASAPDAALAGLQGALPTTAPTIAADTAAATRVRPLRDFRETAVLLIMRLPSCVRCRNLCSAGIAKRDST